MLLHTCPDYTDTNVGMLFLILTACVILKSFRQVMVDMDNHRPSSTMSGFICVIARRKQLKLFYLMICTYTILLLTYGKNHYNVNKKQWPNLAPLNGLLTANTYLKCIDPTVQWFLHITSISSLIITIGQRLNGPINKCRSATKELFCSF